MSKSEIKEILISRDALTPDEADQTLREIKSSLKKIVSKGGSLQEAEDLLREDLNLELDYLYEAILL